MEQGLDCFVIFFSIDDVLLQGLIIYVEEYGDFFIVDVLSEFVKCVIKYMFKACIVK